MSNDVDYALIVCYLLVAAVFHILLGYWVSHRAAITIHRKLKDGEFDALIDCFLNRKGVEIIANVLDQVQPRFDAMLDSKIQTIGPVLVEQLGNKLDTAKGQILNIGSQIAKKDRKGRRELAEELIDQYAPGAKEMLEAAGLDIDPEQIVKYGPMLKERLSNLQMKGKSTASNTPKSISNPEELRRFLHG